MLLVFISLLLLFPFVVKTDFIKTDLSFQTPIKHPGVGGRLVSFGFFSVMIPLFLIIHCYEKFLKQMGWFSGFSLRVGTKGYVSFYLICRKILSWKLYCLPVPSSRKHITSVKEFVRYNATFKHWALFPSPGQLWKIHFWVFSSDSQGPGEQVAQEATGIHKMFQSVLEICMMQ